MGRRARTSIAQQPASTLPETTTTVPADKHDGVRDDDHRTGDDDNRRGGGGGRTREHDDQQGHEHDGTGEHRPPQPRHRVPTVVVDPVQQTTTTLVTPVSLPFTGGGSGQMVALVAAGLLLAGIGLVIASRRGEDPSFQSLGQPLYQLISPTRRVGDR